MSQKLPSPLRDHHGPWCAKCLEYFEGEVEEYHHVYPRWATKTFAVTRPLVWLLPVHRRDCHRGGLQRRSDSIGLALEDMLNKSDGEIRRAAESAFQRGNLNLSFILSQESISRSTSTRKTEELSAHLLISVAAAAGSSIPAVWRSLNASEVDKTIGRASTAVQIQWALSMGNMLRNSYRLDAAAKRYHSAEMHLKTLPTAERQSYKAAYLRRVVALNPSLSIAQQAVSLAREARDPWGTRTADLIEGWNNLAIGLETKARECFERVFYEIQGLPLSWWHRAGAHFGLGICHIVSNDDVRLGVGHCIRAQYIRACLAISGDVVVGVRIGHRQLHEGLDPSQVIAAVGDSLRKRFGRPMMRAIRREFIDQNLQQELFSEMQVGRAGSIAV